MIISVRTGNVLTHLEYSKNRTADELFQWQFNSSTTIRSSPHVKPENFSKAFRRYFFQVSK